MLMRVVYRPEQVVEAWINSRGPVFRRHVKMPGMTQGPHWQAERVIQEFSPTLPFNSERTVEIRRMIQKIAFIG
jgi:hypothetical protein